MECCPSETFSCKSCVGTSFGKLQIFWKIVNFVIVLPRSLAPKWTIGKTRHTFGRNLLSLVTSHFRDGPPPGARGRMIFFSLSKFFAPVRTGSVKNWTDKRKQQNVTITLLCQVPHWNVSKSSLRHYFSAVLWTKGSFHGVPDAKLPQMYSSFLLRLCSIIHAACERV